MQNGKWNMENGFVLLGIERTPHTATAFIQDMRIDHRGAHVLVTQEFLHGPNIVARFQQMGRKAVPKRVTASILPNPGSSQRCLDCALHILLGNMMPSLLPRAWIC